MSQFMTIGEVSTLLRKSTKSIYRIINDLPGSFKVGGAWLVDSEVLLASLKKSATKEKAGSNPMDRHRLLG